VATSPAGTLAAWPAKIDAGKLYLVRINDSWMDAGAGGWFVGQFDNVHYGWVFRGWHAPIQLSLIWLVYDITGGLPTTDLEDPNCPPKP
jgi:hypothetical protein